MGEITRDILKTIYEKGSQEYGYHFIEKQALANAIGLSLSELVNQLASMEDNGLLQREKGFGMTKFRLKITPLGLAYLNHTAEDGGDIDETSNDEQ